MMRKFVLAAWCVIAPSLCLATPITIDDFLPGSGADSNVTLVLLGGAGGPVTDGPDAAPGAIGARTTTLTRLGGVGVLSATTDPPPDLFSIAASDDPGIGNATIVAETVLSYEGFSVDLTDAGTNDFISIVVEADGDTEASTMTLELTDAAAVVYTLTKAIAIGPQNLKFDFASLGVADGTLIEKIVVRVISDDAADINIDLIQAGLVPEPASMVLGLMGFAGLGLIRRKAKKA